MFDAINETVQSIGPLFAGSWLLTIALAILRPQKYFNSLLLMISLMITVVFISGLLGEDGPTFLVFGFVLTLLALFTVPVLLIINGIQVIRRESFSLAHCLSLALGIFVGLGEIASVFYVFGFYQDGPLNMWALLATLTVFYFSMLVLNFVLYSIFIQILPHRMDFNYVIIHGCGLADGEHLTKLLSNRVDKAMDIYRRCAEKPIIIPSGGQGSDEKISEAQAMKRYLLEHGIPEESIIVEDRSTTTSENLAFSKAIIDSREGGRKTALVSSNYHVYRCLKLAKQVGLTCTGIGADVALYYWPSALIREFIAVFLTKGFLFWSLLGYVLLVGPLVHYLFG